MQQDLPPSCTPDFAASEAGDVAYTKTWGTDSVG
jgi:hypothetical protein